MTIHCGDAVEQAEIRPGMTVGELLDELGRAGAYNAGSLWKAAGIYERMLRDEGATRFFGLAGAMVPAGMGGIVSDLIRRGHIDVLVSTGANLTHDIIEGIGCRHYHGTAVCSDIELREEEINRIYDVFLPNEAFIRFEEFMQDVYGELAEGSTISISDLLRAIGGRLESGILAAAAEKEIPVYCPAIQDSMIGLQDLALLPDAPRGRGCLRRYARPARPLLYGGACGCAACRRGCPEELHPPEHAHD